MLGLRLRARRRLHVAAGLVTDGKLDEAEQLLDQLARAARPRTRANLEHLRAVADRRRGDLERALVHADACARLGPPRRRAANLVYWQNQFERLSILLELGRAEPARAALAVVAGAPPGEWFVWQRRKARLHAAFAGCAEPPDDETLHAWARDALGYNHTGILCGLLGWAFDRRGDAEMSALCLREAPARFLRGPEPVATGYPRLWAWLGPRLEEAAAAARSGRPWRVIVAAGVSARPSASCAGSPA